MNCLNSRLSTGMSKYKPMKLNKAWAIPFGRSVRQHTRRSDVKVHWSGERPGAGKPKSPGQLAKAQASVRAGLREM
jgi:hypothetical protein